MRTVEALVFIAVASSVLVAAEPEKKKEDPEAKGIEMCRRICEGQMIYRRTDYDKDGVLEYSQRISGKYSLLENREGKGDVGLVRKAIADAAI